MRVDKTGDAQLLDDGTPASVHIDVTVEPQYFLATAHRRPVPALSVTNMSLQPGEDDRELVVTVEVDSVLGESPLMPKAVALPLPEVGDSTNFKHFVVQPNRGVLARLEERVQATVVVTARLGDRVVGVVRRPIEFLAHNQWMFVPAYFDSLAAFVQPNSPMIDGIITRTRTLLMERTGRRSTEGYQGSLNDGSRRVHQMAEAVFDALLELRLDYTDPPASFEGAGQKVRTPDVVMSEGAATCLDSAVLYASCLARIGLGSQIVLLDGHAVAGYSVTEATGPFLAEPVVSNVNVFDGLLGGGQLRVVETTAFTATHKADFSTALSTARRTCEQQGAFRGMINVASAVHGGVVPLPSRGVVMESGVPQAAGEVLSSDDGVITRQMEVDGLIPVGVSTNDEMVDDAVSRREAVVHPPRIEAWLRSLLDLSYRNPLIRMRAPSRTSTILELDLPPGVTSVIEDRLMSGSRIVIEAATEAPSGLQNDPDGSDTYSDHVTRSGKVFHPGLDVLDAQQRDLVDELEKENPGTPTSRLVVEANRKLHDGYRADLERIMRSLQRRATDIERRTGSNNLFLCIGRMEWVDEADNDKKGAAPLFLIPVRVKGGRGRGYAVSADESADVMPNWALLEKLRQSHGITLSSLETPITDDAGIDVEALISGVRSELIDARIKSARVSDAAALAVLDFSSFRLWRDLYYHWETFLQSPVLNHLVNSPWADFVDPNDADGVAVDGIASSTTATQKGDTSDITRLLCPVEADESQLEAVRAAVSGKTFVLEGPPGTGKSQTITNLLAASMAAGMKVLFVAEKAAALDVVRKRMDQVGLGPLCLELFDKEAKPEHIRSQIRAALDLQPPDISPEWTDVANRVDAGGRRLEDYRDAIHVVGPAGMSLWAARQELIRLGEGPMAELPRDSTGDVGAHTDAVVQALIELPRVVPGETVDHPHRWALATRTDLTQIDIPRLTWAVEMLSWARSVFASQPAAVVDALFDVEDPAVYGRAADAVENGRRGVTLDNTEIDVIGSPEWSVGRDSLLVGITGFLDDLGPLRDVFRPTVLTDDLGAVMNAGNAASNAGVLGRRGARRRFMTELLPFLVDPGTELDTQYLMALLHRVPDQREQWSRLHASAAGMPGVRLSDGWSLLDPVSVQMLRDQLAELPAIAEAARSPLSGVLVGHLDLSRSTAEVDQLVMALRGASDAWEEMSTQLGTDRASFDRWLADRPFAVAWAESEDGWSDDVGRFLQLQRHCTILATLRPVMDAGLDRFVDSILRGHVPVADAETRLRRAVADAVIRERLESAGLDQFDGLAHDRTVEDYAVHFEDRRRLMVQRIPGEMVSRRPLPPGRRIGKWGELERHLASGRRKLSIRRLIQDYGRFVGDLTPCFLMSPDSVARFIPPGSMTFDLVVFDEASQIEVPRGAGALGRSRAAVIVGDTKQMPPSRFGGRPVGDDDIDADGTELDVVTDLESLLEECKESRVPTLTLKCHYRSRHESLIAFSNRNFYDDDLTTFPSPVPSDEAPIHWRRIDGRFRRRARRLPDGWEEKYGPWPVGTNVIEAHAVIDEIRRRLADPELAKESIGVVTSNQPQRVLIQDLLLDLGDPRVSDLLERDDDRGLLIQNLENVQGDERDVILMSIGFSPEIDVSDDGAVDRGRLHMNFGPLNQRGGERRLNVAITRARSSMTVFCSFDPEEMSVSSGSPRGIQLLHSFLTAARDGVRHSGDLVGRMPSVPDRHRRSIADALRSRGLVVDENVGLSRFRVDLAIGMPGDDGYRVAMLLDGPDWAERDLPYDRDVLPVSVLEGLMGWSKVVRVWLPMWLRSPDDVLAKIEHAVHRARPGVNRLVEAVEPVAPVINLVDGDAAGGSVVVDTAHAAPVIRAAGEGVAAERVARAEIPDVGEDLSHTSDSQDELHTDPEDDVFGAETSEFGADVDLSVIGSRDELDRLSDGHPGTRLGSVIDDLVSRLGPVELEMLCKLVAARFDLSRVVRSRVEAIGSAVPSAMVSRDDLGTFVWPVDLDRSTWTGFRRTGETLSRHLDQTPPEEIRNAMIHCVRLGTEVRETELFGLVAGLFGHRRQTAVVKERLRRVADRAVADGHLSRVDDSSYVIG